eukprot:maker-scaffold194_size270518-snap-gene-0.12 protein:Tk00338 transcript:maker-scaffold194_size270518-snap-gene-0.12-mRNA-1 annotation:"nadph-dependent fmn reductase"
MYRSACQLLSDCKIKPNRPNNIGLKCDMVFCSAINCVNDKARVPDDISFHSILESNSTRECLFVFFTVAAIIGPLMNWKIIQSLGSSKKYSARVDHFSLLEIWAGVANFPVILSQIWTMVSWTNQDVSEDNPQYLVWWDVPPIGLEFIARFSIVAKGLSSTMIATIRCALIFSHLTNLQLRWITACNWKIIGILSASLAISTLTTDVGFNRFVGLPFYHALTRRHTYQGFAKSVEVYDRLALTFLAMLNLIKFVAYTAIFRYLFRHDKLMEKSLIRDRHCFLKRHKKNGSGQYVDIIHRLQCVKVPLIHLESDLLDV